MWYLAQLVGETTIVAKEKRRKYFNPGKVNYFQCFNALDVDASGSITKVEWIDILREKLLIGEDKINNADLKLMFDIIDADASGDITVKEFSAFLRGASSSVQARGMAEIVKVKKNASTLRASLNRGTSKPGKAKTPKASNRAIPKLDTNAATAATGDGAHAPKTPKPAPHAKKKHGVGDGSKRTPRTARTHKKKP